MSTPSLDTETIMDVSVNIVPLAILGAFFVLFVVYDPFGWDPMIVIITLSLLVVPIVSLAYVTFVAGRLIERAEKQPI